MTDLTEKIRLYNAGAIVIHKSFDELIAYKNDNEITQEFIDTWVKPYYMRLGETGLDWIEFLESKLNSITKEIVLTLLGDFNWRTRQTGAYFAAIKNYQDLIDIIGIHLLKSEVCDAGRIYCLTLASFNSTKSEYYIDRYLEYYLSRPELWFEQREAMVSLSYLDRINHTNKLTQHQDNWINFIKNKPYWSPEIETKEFEQKINIISNLRQKGSS